MCLFHEQMEKHFWPSPSPDCMGILDRHMSGGRHKITETMDEEIKSFHIMLAIEKSNEFARRTVDSIKK